jgi:hypothetical protein
VLCEYQQPITVVGNQRDNIDIERQIDEIDDTRRTALGVGQERRATIAAAGEHVGIARHALDAARTARALAAQHALAILARAQVIRKLSTMMFDQVRVCCVCVCDC